MVRVFFRCLSFDPSAGSADHTSVYAEHLDFSRFGGNQYDDLLRSYLREKYRSRPIGLLVAQGASSLEFLLRSRGELWPGTPIVFAGIDEETGKRLNFPPGVTGVLYQRTFRNIVTSAQALLPNLKRIALVGDAWERQAVRRHYREEIPAFASQFEFINLLGLPMTEIRKRVSALPDDTAIIYTSVTFDGAGVTYVPHQGLAAFANVANRPIVIDVETNIGYGGVGGLVTTPVPVGEASARIALRILDGEEASKIPVTTGDFTRPIFDWRELQRFGISENRLPAGSEIRFRQLGLWDQYRWELSAILAVVLTAGPADRRPAVRAPPPSGRGAGIAPPPAGGHSPQPHRDRGRAVGVDRPRAQPAAGRDPELRRGR